MIAALKRINGPASIALVYSIFGFLWIFFSDKILLQLSPNNHVYIQFQTYKGWIYVFLTTLLIYTLLKLYDNRKQKALMALQSRDRVITQNLKEKDILLKEVHHRVRNNLQVMISLLKLKRQNTENSDLCTCIDEIINRIYSIALIHQKLYHTELLSEVAFHTYIHNICQYLERFHHTADYLSIHQDLDPVILPVDSAIPCGMLINEIISNTMLYAFPERQPGTLSIVFKVLDEKQYFLQLRHNGIRFDQNDQIKKESAFGQKLIQIFSEQMNGALHIETGAVGTVYTLTFSQIAMKKPRH